MQEEPKGTGNALAQVVPHLMEGSRLLVLLGDAPLVKRKTMKACYQKGATLLF